MLGNEINWLRWLVLLVMGVPLLVWLVATRDNVLRVIAVLLLVVFIQDVFVWRRYVVAIGIGPSLIVTYVALIGLYLRHGRFPSLGAAGLLWAFFLLSAVIAGIVGSIGTPLVFAEIANFQEFYLEGFFFFLLGVMALSEPREVNRFFRAFIELVAMPLALFHLFQTATGWQPAAIAASQTGDSILTGAVFGNPNTLADFWAMTLPVALVLLRERQSTFARARIWGAVVTIAVSLLLTGARGGILFSFVVSAIALALSGTSIARVVAASVFIGVLAVIALLLGRLLFPNAFGELSETFQEQGLQSDRLRTWGTFITILLQHPIGVGLHPENLQPLAREHGTGLASAHNIYLDLAIKLGLQGLFAFLALVGYLAARNARAIRAATADPARRIALVCCLLPLLGFLLGGLVEPIYHNGAKIGQIFWLLCGVGFAACGFAVAPAVAPAAEAAVVVSPWRPRERPAGNG